MSSMEANQVSSNQQSTQQWRALQRSPFLIITTRKILLLLSHSLSIFSLFFQSFPQIFPHFLPWQTHFSILAWTKSRSASCSTTMDENDRVVGHESKYNCHLMENIESKNWLHPAFSVFLFNSKYELLLQQRSATKVTFPLVWTNTCCSHPLYRESELIEEEALGARNAAQRKLLDELGIPAEDVPVDEFIPLGRMLYKAPSDGKCGEHELDYLLFIVRDVNVNPNPDEVADVKYVNKEQLKELVRKADGGEEGLKLSPWFRLVVDNFLFKWWDHVEKGTLK
ncbi:isopentenyl-diphosphate Delta-isomerase I-like isoform X1 [Cucurbita pepo subsp. pepo]|uniref:isopentenyl-diphosphate Delta-isomerase I-like isoform X1 n=1 Tax=Cucurbita pepo subsp. pepo TaxID=3664 RepID=UPI000C9D65F2|nr:isopentenyl-diphosphate Delta-isomerase I-like isoform X1 [Cucurbita pepo subsp. pepo]